MQGRACSELPVPALYRNNLSKKTASSEVVFLRGVDGAAPYIIHLIC